MQSRCSLEVTNHEEDMAEEFIAKCNDEWEYCLTKNLNPKDWLSENTCSPDRLFSDSWVLDGKESKNGWLNEHVNSNPVLRDIDKGTLYVMLVSGILKKSLKKSKIECLKKFFKSFKEFIPFQDDADHKPETKKIHPIVIASALITEKHLKHERLDDQIKVAIKIRAAMRNIWGRHSRSMYRETYEADIRRIPRDFVEALVKECISPEDTELLLDIADKEVLFNLREGKFRKVIQETAYKKLYRENVFWESKAHDIQDGLILFVFTWLERLLHWILWNLLYIIQKGVCNSCKLLSESQTKKLFSPISCFIADIVNYFIMVVLIGTVLFKKGAGTNQESAEEVALQFTQGNITIGDNARLKAGDTADFTLIELDKSPMSLEGFVLFFCFLSKFLVEIQQFSQQRIFSVVPKKIRSPIWCWIKLWKKSILYLRAHSHMNVVDLLVLIILGTALIIDFDYSFHSDTIYGKICQDETCVGNIDYTLEDRRIIHMINLYGVALLLSAVRLFYCIFAFFPVIGPILISMKTMIEDVVKIIIIILFLSIGFFIPLLAISQVYRSVYYGEYTSAEEGSIFETEEDGNDDNKIFKRLRSLRSGFYTMILSLMNGQLTNAHDVYDSRDPSINGLFFVIMVGYFLVVGLLCFNLLIAIVTKRYEKMMGSGNREWELYKFNVVLDYLCFDTKEGEIGNDGMPFLFPISLIYMTCILLVRIINAIKKKTCEVPKTCTWKNDEPATCTRDSEKGLGEGARSYNAGENKEKRNTTRSREEVLTEICDRRDRTSQRPKET